MSAVRLRDVTLRDGLQTERPISTARKLLLFEALVAAGVTDLELCSFVRPDLVPAMADAPEIAAATTRPTVTRWALVLNSRGAWRALDAGVYHLQFVVSVSDRHSLANAGRPTDLALAELETIVPKLPFEAQLEVTLATAFGCPYTGAVTESTVLGIAQRCLELGVKSLSLADTIGTAIPSEVARLVRSMKTLMSDGMVGLHLHDTRGLGIVNALTALDAEVDRLDGAVGGLGGCPFAPGASGNLALEDLVHVLEAEGIATGIDLDHLIEAAQLACRLTGRQPASHVAVAGPRFQRLAEEAS